MTILNNDPQAQTSAPAPAPQPPARKAAKLAWYKDAYLLASVLGVFLLDRLTKVIVVQALDLYESWPRDGFFRFTYGQNTGTAFGLFPNQTVALIFASFIAIGFLIYFYRTHAMPSRLLRLAIGLQLGGAFGNLFDRMMHRAVVDFIDVGPWPIFNLADSSIVVGIGLLVVAMFITTEPAEKKPAPAVIERLDSPAPAVEESR
ncbi:MAG: signal peptidase II [SAR202 cluster bacterium]|nr:signal peptidase II [SAR202 cluster bacterium]